MRLKDLARQPPLVVGFVRRCIAPVGLERAGVGIPDGAMVLWLYCLHLQPGGQGEIGNVIERGAFHDKKIAFWLVAGFFQQGRARGFALGDERMMGGFWRAAVRRRHLALVRLQPRMQSGTDSAPAPLWRHDGKLPVQPQAVCLRPVPGTHIAGYFHSHLGDPHVPLRHAAGESRVVPRHVFDHAENPGLVGRKARVGAGDHGLEV